MFREESFSVQIELLKELNIIHNSIENPMAELNNFCLKQWGLPPDITCKQVGTSSAPQTLVIIKLPGKTETYKGKGESKKAAKAAAALKALEAVGRVE